MIPDAGRALLGLAAALLARLGFLWRAAATDGAGQLMPAVPLVAMASPYHPRLSLGLRGSYAKPQTGGEP